MLQLICRLLSRPKCFRLGRVSPVGISTRGFEVPWQGTHNNQCERSLRGIAIGRRNWLFVGSPAGGKAAAAMFSLISSAKRHHVEPLAYLTDLFTRLPATPVSQLPQFLPDAWQPRQI